ncbi:MAG: hypothetical protein JW731_00885 [Bacteroidales bacterium]|nr:hypothetical protein [Bacteroidales bacterium]
MIPKRIFYLAFVFLLISKLGYGSDNDDPVFQINSLDEPAELNKFWKYHPGDDTL